MWQKLKRYNKAHLALIAGAIVTMIAGQMDITPEIQGSAQTIITWLLVMAIGNGK